MNRKTIISIEMVVDYIESHLNGKLELSAVAAAVHYSKYHLHRLFTDTVGMTIHDYIARRQLSEAAKLLVFSQKPIIEIALICGYESQQAFSAVFKSMYKMPPAQYRHQQAFYPLQLRFSLHRNASNATLAKSNIRFAQLSDIPQWMELVRLAIDGFPHLDEKEYQQTLSRYIHEKRAFLLMDDPIIIGAMMFSYDTGSIEFMGIHPQYRSIGVQKLFLDKLMEELLPGRNISITTYREYDKADTGYRSEIKQFGFAEAELLVEFGYPTQRFVLPAQK